MSDGNSDTDGFFREVSEEVARDRMNRQFKKWAPWIGAGVIAVTAGAAGWSWQLDRDRRAEEEIGRILLSDDPSAIRNYADSPTGGGAILARLHLAGIEAEAGNADRALLHYESIAEDPAAPPAYADLAALRALRLRAVREPAAALLPSLDPLTAPGRGYRLLALELRAVLLLNDDRRGDALADLRAILADPERTGNLHARVEQLLLAVGGAENE